MEVVFRSTKTSDIPLDFCGLCFSPRPPLPQAPENFSSQKHAEQERKDNYYD